MTEWICKKKFKPEDFKGFVYIITHIPSGKFYIGKKNFWRKITRKPLKGRKNKRIDYKESNWRDYWSSSDYLKSDVQKQGKSKFKREIIRLCTSAWELSYYEAKYQFDMNVLLRRDSYNGIINLRVNKPKEYRD